MTAHFTYRRLAGPAREFPVEVEVGIRFAVFACPLCWHRARLNPDTIPFIVEQDGSLTVTRLVRCPAPLCGWEAIIFDGRAIDPPDNYRADMLVVELFP